MRLSGSTNQLAASGSPDSYGFSTLGVRNAGASVGSAAGAGTPPIGSLPGFRPSLLAMLICPFYEGDETLCDRHLGQYGGFGEVVYEAGVGDVRRLRSGGFGRLKSVCGRRHTAVLSRSLSLKERWS